MIRKPSRPGHARSRRWGGTAATRGPPASRPAACASSRPMPCEPGRVGRARPQRRRAAGAEHDRARGDRCARPRTTSRRQRPSPRSRHPQRPRARALEHRYPRLLGRQRRQLRAPGAARWRCRRRGRCAGPSARPPRPSARRPKRSASKRTPSACRSRHALGRLAHEHLGGRAPDQPAPGALGVAQMQLGAVVRGQRGRQPALRPVAGGLRQRRRRDEHDTRAPRARRTAPHTARPRPRPPPRRRPP